MSIRLMSAIWDNGDNKLNGSKLTALLCLADHADDEGICYPSIARVAERTRMSPRQATRIIRELEDSGYVAVTRVNGARNQYKIYSTPLREFAESVSTPDMHDRGDTDDTPDTDDRGTPDMHDRGPLTPVTGESSYESSCEPSLATVPQDYIIGSSDLEERKPRRKRKAEHDILLEHPAVVEYRDQMHITPNRAQRQAIANACNWESAAEFSQWSAVLTTWQLRGWNPRNVAGQIAAFQSFDDFAARQGIKVKKAGKSQPDPPSQRQLDEIRRKQGESIREA